MSLVLSHSGAVFLHPYKTGGTWVRKALTNAGVEWKDVGYQHLNYISALEVSPNFPRFTIVRNPYTWYLSFWMFRTLYGWGGDLPIGHGAFANINFSDFIKLVTKQWPAFVTRMFRAYAAVSEVTVLRTETLSYDLEAYLKKVGEPFNKQGLVNTPRVNQAGTLVEGSPYTRKLAGLVLRSEMDTFVKYDYDFESFNKLRNE